MIRLAARIPQTLYSRIPKIPYTMSISKVLRCDSASITFNGNIDSSDLPKVGDEETSEALRVASHHLEVLDDVVIMPTETVYGLAANALSPTAVSRIFSTKGRPQDNPLIVHVSSLPMLNTLLPKSYSMPPPYRTLINAFWPGALTLLFPADSSIVPRGVTAGHPTVAVRMPAHPVARGLIALSGKPLAAPSANSSGKPSPTRAEHVMGDLGVSGKVAIVLDGGPCDIGLESTVVDGLGEDGNVRVLRPGGVTVEDLEKVLADAKEKEGWETLPRVLVHKRDYQDTQVESAPTTPGMKYRHYAPSVPVILLARSDKEPSLSLSETLEGISKRFSNPKMGILAPSDSLLLACMPSSVRHFPLGLKEDPATSAARLFDGLLTLEKEGVDVILIEEIPEEREGLAFMNRARKAAGDVAYIQ